MKKIILILGAPGSGKTTTLQKVKSIEFSHYSIGETFRQNIKEDTEIGKEVKRYTDIGQIVPIHIAQKVIESYIDDWKDLIIIDDYPRDMEQAKMLETIITHKAEVVGVIEFLVDKQIALSRITSRARGVDDNPIKFEDRMRVYREKIESIRNFYIAQNKYWSLQNNYKTDNAKEELENILKALFNEKV